MMNTRIDFNRHISSKLGQAMLALSAASQTAGLERSLLELVRMRASQINHCAYCIDMHTKDARAHGETEQRLYALSAWRETPFYFRARARGTRMDRGSDTRRRDSRAGRHLRARAAALRRIRTGGADLRRRRHQQLESAGGVVSRPCRDLSAAGARTRLILFCRDLGALHEWLWHSGTSPLLLHRFPYSVKT